jgi:hypothetical protein
MPRRLPERPPAQVHEPVIHICKTYLNLSNAVIAVVRKHQLPPALASQHSPIPCRDVKALQFTKVVQLIWNCSLRFRACHSGPNVVPFSRNGRTRDGPHDIQGTANYGCNSHEENSTVAQLSRHNVDSLQRSAPTAPRHCRASNGDAASFFAHRYCSFSFSAGLPDATERSGP